MKVLRLQQLGLVTLHLPFLVPCRLWTGTRLHPLRLDTSQPQSLARTHTTTNTRSWGFFPLANTNIMDARARRDAMVVRAGEYVREVHSVAAETALYNRLLDDIYT